MTLTVEEYHCCNSPERQNAIIWTRGIQEVLVLTTPKTKRAPIFRSPFLFFELYPGGDLRSHTVTRAVSSAQRGLTTVFGMGTGVTPAM